MPRGDKGKYTDKQKRMAEHIEEGYEKRGLPEEEAERRAWATVNKTTYGGRKPGGSGRGIHQSGKQPARRQAGRGSGGKASRSRPQRLGTESRRYAKGSFHGQVKKEQVTTDAAQGIDCSER